MQVDHCHMCFSKIPSKQKAKKRKSDPTALQPDAKRRKLNETWLSYDVYDSDGEPS